MKAAKYALLLLTFCLVPCLIPCPAHASVALFLEQPFGVAGHINPTGHSAVYLSNVCADTPTHLRRCHAGEQGIVISRYHRVAGHDWLAIPLMAYLYAVDDAKQIPTEATPVHVAALRDAYRREHLLDLAPDAPDGTAPGGEWVQLVGSLYDRKIYVYQIDTPPGRDDALIAHLNQGRNKSHFNLFFHNCADFSLTLLNFYYPHSVHRNVTADLGMTTPKQLARSLTRYAKRHEAMDLRVYAMPQVPGSIPRSRQVNGISESFVKTKYVVPLAIFQPVIAVGMVTDYLVSGRFNPERNAVPLPIGDVRNLYAQDAASVQPANQSSGSVTSPAPDRIQPDAGERPAVNGSRAAEDLGGTE